MNDESDPTNLMAVFTVVLLIIASVVFYGCGEHSGRKSMQTEAVKRGYATWHVSHEGDTAFAWKEAVK